MISHRRWLAVTIGVLLVAGGIAATLPDATQERLDRLTSGELKNVLVARRELIRERERKIAALLDIVKSIDNQKKNGLAVGSGIQILGEMRATEAVPVLVKLVSYPLRRGDGILTGGADISSSSRSGPWWSVGHRNNAKWALVRIGRPAVPALWQELRTTPYDDRLKNALGVLVQIEGLKEIDRRIEESLKQTADSSIRENLELGQQLVEKKKAIDKAGGYLRWLELQKQKREERMKERDARK